MNIEGSVALVTGANRGLGRALVSALVDAGAAKVYAAARDPRTLVAGGPRIVPLALDTTSTQQIEAAAARANDVTLLVNNAGVLTSFNVLRASAAELDADYRTNVLGTRDMIRAFLPALARAPNGATIVNVLSLAVLASVPSMGGYASSKAAAYSMTQAMRPELAAMRIALLAALPGPIDTDMVKAMQMPKASPEEVARGVLAGIARGDEEIFPDTMAQQMAVLWNTNHKELERAFAGF
jgi:NAD(P)-dependent dehydrogenase (short-subunit alcohol dehydrogenase family)